MAIKSAYITSSIRPNVRLYVEQTAKNTQYGTLTVTVQMNGASIDAYNSPTINMSSVDSSYVWTGSSGTITSSSWTNVFQKSGIIVWYTSASTRTITINTNGSYSWDRTEEGGDSGSELYAFGGDFEMSPKSVPSSPTITVAASSVNLGSSVNITTANGSSGAMTATIGNHTETVMTVGNGTNPWTPTLATWGTYITGSSAVATLRWNNVSTTISVVMPEDTNTKPTISTIGTTLVNGLNNLYVQSRSKVTVNVTASGKYGASITAYSITMNGVTYNTNGATSGVLNNSGTNTISVTVTDSRGFTSTSSTTITVQAYTAPTITSANIFRSTSAKAADPNGTYITYNFYTTVASVNSNNAKKYGLQYRTQGASSWTSTEGTLSAYTSTQTSIAYGSGNISTTTVYEARAYVKDSFQTVYSTIFTIPTASVIMDFNTAGTGGGIGMYTQAANQLDIGWTVIGHKSIRGWFKGIANNESIEDSIQFVPRFQVANTYTTEKTITEYVLKTICANYPNKTRGIYIGTYQAMGKSSTARLFMIYIANTPGRAADGLPQYATGLVAENYNKNMYLIDCSGYTVTVFKPTLSTVTT